MSFPVAGYGTRFLPATGYAERNATDTDKPLIQYVEEVADAGLGNICFVTGRGKRAIEDHFDVSFELKVLLRAPVKKRP